MIATTALVCALPQLARADVTTVNPSSLVQAGLSAAQREVDAAASAGGVAVPAVPSPSVAGTAPSASGAAAVAPPAPPTVPPSSDGAAPVSPRPAVSPPPAPPVQRTQGRGVTPRATARTVPVPAPVTPPSASVPSGHVSVPSVQVPSVHVSAPILPASVPGPPPVSMPVALPAPPAPVVRIPPIDLSSAARLAALVQPPAPTVPVPSPALGDPAQQEWPLSLGIPVSGVLPPSPDALGAGIFALTGTGVDLSRPEGQARSTSRTGPRHVHRAASVVPQEPWLRPGAPVHLLGPPGGAAAAVGHPAVGSHRLPADRRTGPRPAHPPSAPILAAPPISSPITGGGPAAAGAGTGGAAAAASLMALAALLLLSTLSTRVSLDMSAWRSTLLSLRLERPG